jgi:hypothetical protein
MIFEQILAEEKVDPVTSIGINSLEAVKQLILKGLG